jgi:acid phosphatase
VAGVLSALAWVGAAHAPVAALTTHPSKVLVVMEENHSYAEMRAGMPYLFGLSRRYGYATDWRAIRHTSLPNYLAITGGSTFGVTDNQDPAAYTRVIGRARSVFDQAVDEGKTAGAFVQAMPRPCFGHDHRSGAASYAVRHNPWPYFPASRARCRRFDVSLGRLDAMARADALPNVGLLVPDLCEDAHDCSLAEADSFLRRTLPDVLSSSDFTDGRLVVVVTSDEDDHRSGNRVLTSVLAARVSGTVVRRHLTHYSLTRYLAEVLGVRPLRQGRSAPDMRAAFGL